MTRDTRPPTRARKLLLASGFLCLLGGAIATGFYVVQSVDTYRLPTHKLRFEDLKPASAVEVSDANGQILDYWYDKRLRLYRPLTQIASKLPEFVVFLEDAKFFWHEGFDVEEIKNSIEKNIEKGKIKRGASTITQQLAKNMFLDKERSIARKLFEVPWTYRLEKDLSKKQILELYLNVIEWGPGIYGAEAAARHYFDKTAAELDVGNCMYLALIVPNPPRFDLLGHPRVEEFIEKKRSWLVDRLVDEKKIPPEEKEAYMTAPFGLVPPDQPGRRFPVSHEGDYYGNHNRRSSDLKLLETRLRGQARGKQVRVDLETKTLLP